MGWPQQSSGGPFPQHCLAPPRTHVVSVTLPDGRAAQRPGARREAQVGRGNRSERLARRRQHGIERLRETTHVLPDSSAETRTYDDAGNLAGRTDFAGRTTAYAYDANNRLTSRTYPDAGVASFTYTPTGRRLTRAA